MSPTQRAFLIVGHVVVILVIVATMASQVKAQDDDLLSMKQTSVINAVGDARVELRITTSIQNYTRIKQENPNVALLLRQFGAGRTWNELQDIDGHFDDDTHSIVMTYTHKGLGRETQRGRWKVPLRMMKDAEVIGNFENDLILSAVLPSPLGWTSRVDVIRFPESAERIKFDDRRNQISYDYEGDTEVGPRGPRLDLFVDTKPMLLSCLAKCYSDDEFNYMWAARSLLENTGDAPVEDFRIRFRVAGLSSWSPWNRTSTVFPGQTVVDPFFPVFDLKAMAELNNSRPSMIEVEYQYRDPSGELVQDSDSYPIQVLARNQVVFTSLDQGDCVSFFDDFDNLPPVMASLTTPTDPVVQQLVGRIHGYATSQAGHGIAASTDTGDAVSYMRAIHDFIRINKIAYQTPPGLLVDGHEGQHIKYSRDVLRNRAGTCIDLTVFWLSVLESAGLEPVAVVIPGHAFPAVRLPNGNLLAIESTALDATFDQAVAIGMENLENAELSTTMLIDIAELRAEGITPIDLPKAPVDFLTKMNYDFDVAQTEEVEYVTANVEQEQRESRRENTDNERRRDTRNDSPLVGRWHQHAKGDEVEFDFDLNLSSDGSVRFTFDLDIAGKEPTHIAEEGHWSVDGDLLVLDMGEHTYEWPIELQSRNELLIEVTELEFVFETTRK